jgi:hypothetical protein
MLALDRGGKDVGAILVAENLAHTFCGQYSWMSWCPFETPE